MDPYIWSLPLADSIDTTTQEVLLRCAQYNHLPQYTFFLATLPRSANGLSMFSATTSSTTAFVLPLVQII
eukprot:14699311-Ditylum_brightwellii.AAC.1